MAVKRIATGILTIALAATPLVAQQKTGDRPEARQPGGPTIVSEPGVLVVGIEVESPALKAGLARGTILLEVDGTAVNDVPAVEKLIGNRKAGEAVSLKVLSGETERTIQATLGSRDGRAWLGIVLFPDGGDRGPGGPGNDRADNRGFGGPGNDRMAAGRGPMGPGGQPQEPPMMPGCRVEKVVSGSPAEKAGLKNGDVILSVDGTRIDPRHDISSLLGAKKAGDTVTLSVQSRGQAPRDQKVTLAKGSEKDGPFLGVEISPNPPIHDGGDRPGAAPGGAGPIGPTGSI